MILKTSDIDAVDDGLLPPALQWRRATPGVDEHESHHRDDERQPADHHHGHADVSQSSPEGLAGVSEQVLLAHAAVRLVFLHTRRAPFPLTQLRQPEDKTRVASVSKRLVARWQTGVRFITVLIGVKQATGNLMANRGSVYAGFNLCKTATCSLMSDNGSVYTSFNRRKLFLQFPFFKYHFGADGPTLKNTEQPSSVDVS